MKARPMTPEADAMRRKLLSGLKSLHHPRAEELRRLPGDQKMEDRYWIGWTDALDEAVKLVRAGL
jgi:hypothetical protein